DRDPSLPRRALPRPRRLRPGGHRAGRGAATAFRDRPVLLRPFPQRSHVRRESPLAVPLDDVTRTGSSPPPGSESRHTEPRHRSGRGTPARRRRLGRRTKAARTTTFWRERIGAHRAASFPPPPRPLSPAPPVPRRGPTGLGGSTRSPVPPTGTR